MKKILWGNTENWDELLVKRAEISGTLVLSEFTKKALQKFKK
jgi:methylglutaconyl-CoA hydratase